MRDQTSSWNEMPEVAFYWFSSGPGVTGLKVTGNKRLIPNLEAGTYDFALIAYYGPDGQAGGDENNPAWANITVPKICAAGTRLCAGWSSSASTQSVTVPATATEMRSGITAQPGRAYRFKALGTIRVGALFEGPTEPRGWYTQDRAGPGFPAPDASMAYKAPSQGCTRKAMYRHS
jgi:hypothetical protein